MKLTEFDNKKISKAAKALKENYDLPFNVESLNAVSSHSMLRKVRGLMSETRQAPDFYQKQTSPSYMKLVFMEQALSDRIAELDAMPKAKIVVENEEVEKSQVVLAAQDMVDTVQKMLEDVGQMQVKELPALVSSIESEIGTNEAQQYDQQVSQQLDTLSATLKEVFSGMKSALGTVTGQGGDMAAFDAGAEMGADLGAEAGMDAGLDAGEDLDMDAGDEEIPEPDDEIEPSASVGRAKR